MLKEEEYSFILEKAVLAPSADNLQPWKFVLIEDGFQIWLDEDAIKSFCDAGYLVPYISVGAMLENIRVSASRIGLYPDIDYLPLLDSPLHAATVRFSPGRAEEHPHLSVLHQRVTNRKFYDRGRKIDSKTLEPIMQTLRGNTDFQIRWLDKQDPRYEELSLILGDADQLRFENKRLHREFFQILRFSGKETAATLDGLPIPCLEAGPLAGLTFSGMRSWSRMKLLNVFGMSRLMNFYTRLQMQSSAGTLLITSTANQALDYLKGGEVMQQAWHEMTKQGLATQPMEALPIFILDLQVTGGFSLTEAQRQKVKELREKFYRIFGIHDSNALVMLFRVGLCGPPNHRSMRRPFQTFLVE